jgi:glycosyltransferase involved in cell wall biosynthesis
LAEQPGVVVVANTRLPSRRAQALQVVQTSAAFARAGREVLVLHARRRRLEPLPEGVDLWTWYAVAPGPRPRIEAVPCVDWIELVPPALQYWPARLQERSFARNAARTAARARSTAWIWSREVEAALPLLRAGRARVALEIHRVPEGRLRRRELLECARRGAAIVAISGGVRADLVALGVAADGVLVEHDGFEPARFAALPSKKAARERLSLPLDARIVAYTGGLLPWKGVDVLVEAARLSPGTLHVVAGGMEEDLRRLREQARGLANVRFDGFVAPEAVAAYLAAADIGVAPNRSRPAISARHTSPLKVFEAMACGLPLVASDLPSLRDALDESVAVFAAPDDPRALAAAIEGLLSDEARLRGMRLAGPAKAARHSWDARAARILAWLDAGAPAVNYP